LPTLRRLVAAWALPALYGELAHAGQVAEIHHYFATSPDVGVRVIAHTAIHRPALAVAGDERRGER